MISDDYLRRVVDGRPTQTIVSLPEMARELLALRDRVRSEAGVPCADRMVGRQRMRCFGRDKCSFCRARDLLKELGLLPPEKPKRLCKTPYIGGTCGCGMGCDTDDVAFAKMMKKEHL